MPVVNLSYTQRDRGETARVKQTSDQWLPRNPQQTLHSSGLCNSYLLPREV